MLITQPEATQTDGFMHYLNVVFGQPTIIQIIPLVLNLQECIKLIIKDTILNRLLKLTPDLLNVSNITNSVKFS